MMEAYRQAYAHFGADGRYFTKEGRRFDYQDGMGPYEYLMGALCGCFCSTLEDELALAGVAVQAIDAHAYGKKRESVERIMDAVGQACRHCSMYQTIACVSRMHVSCEVI